MESLMVSEEELRTLVVTQMELVDGPQFDRARTMAARLKIPLERALADQGRIPFTFLLEQLAQAWGVGFTDLRVGDVQPEALRLIREEYARAHGLVAFARDGHQLRVAMHNPRDRPLLQEMQRMTRLEIVPYLASEGARSRAQLLYKGNLREMLERAALNASTEVNRPTRPPGAPEARQWGTPADGRASGMKGPVGPDSAVDLVRQMLEYAIVSGASDIHIEPYELELLIRYRVDGVLQEALTLPPTLQPAVVARVKILSSLRIDERRVPQDGRFDADLSGFKVDLRVSTVPTQWGEKVVLRVLSRDSSFTDLDQLGLIGSDSDILLRNLLRPFGMILVTGPTGSGKSTTLYAMVRRIAMERQNAVNISTIEDPVEYTMPRITQIPLAVAAGFDFAGGLRALLRQDPDVIMVGEIRDRETADIGVRAALVGRLFLSSLHTNDATTAVPRLTDMGVEPFLVASTLALVVAQRLARRTCVGCRESFIPDEGVLHVLRDRPDFDQTVTVLQARGALGAGDDPLAGVRLFRGKGCAQCHGTGFRGRVGVFEFFEATDNIRRMIMERHDASAIRQAAIAGGMSTMYQDGLAKAMLGETTIEEVFRVAL
ncbi:MAG TPA: GspE/PulE family protein [Candidatus Binatia bacterium]|nr:GspE/PulE family protein [Candidatus Binatia bacterium]